MIRKLLESKNSSSWLILAIVVFACGLLVSFLTPFIYALTRFQFESNIGFSPSEFSIWYQIIAFFGFGIGLYLVYKFNHVGARVLGGITGVALFAFLTYFSFNSYTYIDEEYIEIGKGFKTLHYTWDEVEELYYNSNGETNWYEIVTKDGERFEIVFGGLIDVGAQNYIRIVLKEYGVIMIDIS